MENNKIEQLNEDGLLLLSLKQEVCSASKNVAMILQSGINTTLIRKRYAKKFIKEFESLVENKSLMFNEFIKSFYNSNDYVKTLLENGLNVTLLAEGYDESFLNKVALLFKDKDFEVAMKMLNKKGKYLTYTISDILYGVYNRLSEYEHYKDLYKMLQDTSTASELLDLLLKDNRFLKTNEDKIKSLIKEFKIMNIEKRLAQLRYSCDVKFDKETIDFYNRNKTFSVKSCEKVSFIEKKDEFFLVKKVGLRYSAFKDNKLVPRDKRAISIFKDESFIIEKYLAYIMEMIRFNMDFDIKFSDINVKKEGFEESSKSAYCFDVSIKIDASTSVDDLLLKVLKLNSFLLKVNLI